MNYTKAKSAQQNGLCTISKCNLKILSRLQLGWLHQLLASLVSQLLSTHSSEQYLHKQSYRNWQDLAQAAHLVQYMTDLYFGEAYLSNCQILHLQLLISNNLVITAYPKQSNRVTNCLTSK